MKAPYAITRREVPQDPMVNAFGYAQITRLVSELNSLKSQWESKLAEVERIHAKMLTSTYKGEPGKEGRQGKPGASIKGAPADPHEVAAVLLNNPDFIAKVKPQDGKTVAPDYEKIVRMVMGLIKLPKDGKDGSVDMGKMSDQIIELMKKKKIKPEHIDGFEQTISAFHNQLVARGGYLHGSGVPSLSAGSNITLTAKPDGGFTVSSTGGSGFSALSATETPDGSKTVFTFAAAAAQPSYLVVDNVWMKATSKAGTVNWTWAAGPKQATLTTPANDDIFAIV